MSEGKWTCKCGLNWYDDPGWRCPKCKETFAAANARVQGFGSSRCSADGRPTTDAERSGDRGVQPALKFSGLTKQEIAKAIRGLDREMTYALKAVDWQRMQRIAVAIGELASIAAWHDAANLDGEQAT